MGKKDPRVDAYIEKAQPFAQPILRHIRKVVHAACPDVEETVKWSHPHFDYKGIFCGMSSFKEHAAFGFWKGGLLKDLVKGMPTTDETAMGQFGRLKSISDLPNDKMLAKIVVAAAKLNDKNISAPRPKPKAKPPIKVPSYFTAALKKNKKAMAAFDAFPPSHRREYLLWITEAKSQETRDRRMGQAIEWIAEGKGRNWKYEKK
jgi:uncharacterized protein YdeI (YjbR/CyaY-like superfamily)